MVFLDVVDKLHEKEANEKWTHFLGDVQEKQEAYDPSIQNIF